MKDWIAVAGLRRFDPTATHTAIPPSVMSDADLSLEAKGLYALLASFQGQPIDPFVDAVEDDDLIAGAIEELISAGLAVRVDATDEDEESPFSDRLINLVAARYPPFETITPTEFEEFVADLLNAAGAHANSFVVQAHETLHAPDGSYEFDAVATYRVLGMSHTLLVEAKRHKNPVKRELVQALHAKLQSVGAHKALMVSAGRYQSGAVRYALAHGIALATVSEGQFTFEAKAIGDRPVVTQEAAAEFGIEPIAAIANHNVPGTSSIRGFRLSPQHGDIVLEWLTG